MVLSFQSLFMSRLIPLNSICFNKGKKVEKRFSKTSRKSVRAVVSYSCHYLITSFLLLLLPLPQYLIINKSPPVRKMLYKEKPVIQSFMTMKYRLNRWMLRWQLPSRLLCDLLTVKYFNHQSATLKNLLKHVRKMSERTSSYFINPKSRTIQFPLKS